MGNTVCILGLGYIGLPTAAVAAGAGCTVIGVDINAERVETVNAGKSPIHEPGVAELIRKVVSNGRLRAATEPEDADYFVVAVPTPLREQNQPDISFVEQSIDSVAPRLRPGNTVIIESTCPVGTTEAMLKRIEKLRPDLHLPQHGRGEDGIAVAYCPERVLPGQIINELQENDRVIGGVTPLCAQKASAFYRTFLTKGQCFETTATTSELVKLAENAYRDVNIAFANELSMIAELNDVNPWELIALASRHPRVNILQPGPGVGGHCIAVDPWFIVAKNPSEARLIRTAREVNLHKTEYTLESILKAVDIRNATSVAMLGLAYKPNVDDLRESPSVELTRALAAKRDIEVLAVEPHITKLPPELQLERVRLASLDEARQKSDLLVLLVKHDVFRSLRDAVPKKPLLDVCGLFV